jgi:hypothetical protein
MVLSITRQNYPNSIMGYLSSMLPELPEQYHGLLVEYAYAMALMKDGVDASQILDKFHSDLDKIKTPEPNYSGEIE